MKAIARLTRLIMKTAETIVLYLHNNYNNTTKTDVYGTVAMTV